MYYARVELPSSKCSLPVKVFRIIFGQQWIIFSMPRLFETCLFYASMNMVFWAFSVAWLQIRSLKSHFKVQSYVFNEQFQLHQKQEFVLSFFKSDDVVKTLLRLEDNWVPVGVSASAVEVETVPCSVVSMTAFAPLTDPCNGLVAPGGRIVGCDHDYGQADGFLIGDQLRKALLDPESDAYNVIPDYLRQEFIFKIFQFLCLGGQWCQYEDDIQPYLDTTKKLYKDLVRVHKNAGTNEVSVSSVVLRVVAKDCSGAAYYPSNPDHPQNLAYLLVDPARRHVTAFHHQFQGLYVP